MTRLRAGWSRIRIPAFETGFSHVLIVTPPLGLTILIFNDYRSSFPREKRPGHKADFSHSSSSETKSKWSWTSPHNAFVLWTGTPLIFCPIQDTQRGHELNAIDIRIRRNFLPAWIRMKLVKKVPSVIKVGLHHCHTVATLHFERLAFIQTTYKH
jgi:hypothetical protein